LDGLGGADPAFIQLELAGRRLRQIEDVVDDAEEVASVAWISLA